VPRWDGATVFSAAFTVFVSIPILSDVIQDALNCLLMGGLESAGTSIGSLVGRFLVVVFTVAYTGERIVSYAPHSEDDLEPARHLVALTSQWRAADWDIVDKILSAPCRDLEELWQLLTDPRNGQPYQAMALVDEIRPHLATLRELTLVCTADGMEKTRRSSLVSFTNLLCSLAPERSPGIGNSLVNFEQIESADTHGGTLEALRKIRREWTFRGEDQHTLICDVTGGTKPMTIGAALASLHPSSRLQYLPQSARGQNPPRHLKAILLDISYLDVEEEHTSLPDLGGPA
jgi:hypothetical protein